MLFKKHVKNHGEEGEIQRNIREESLISCSYRYKNVIFRFNQEVIGDDERRILLFAKYVSHEESFPLVMKTIGQWKIDHRFSFPSGDIYYSGYYAIYWMLGAIVAKVFSLGLQDESHNGDPEDLEELEAFKSGWLGAAIGVNKMESISQELEEQAKEYLEISKIAEKNKQDILKRK